jgi:hypothetical protein
MKLRVTGYMDGSWVHMPKDVAQWWLCEHLAEPCIFHDGRNIAPLLVPNEIKRIYL